MITRNGEFIHYVNIPNDSSSLSYNMIYTIGTDKENGIWIGTALGLNHLNQRGTFDRYLDRSIITKIFTDAAGVVWAGTSQGLFHFNRSTNQFLPFVEPISKITISTVLNIIEDDTKNLWVNTVNGIIKINPGRDVIKIYGENYGIRDELEDIFGQCIANDGQIFFGNASGYYHFYPNDIDDITQPKINIISFKIGDLEVTPQSGRAITKPIWQAERIMLEHFQNNFSFDFLAMHYNSSGDEKYIFMLENHDKEWHHTGSEHKAYFFNVPPGTYLFRVRAVNPDGVWSEKGITIIISPPWWRTWWAYTIFAVLFIAAIWGLVYYRSKKLLKENRILEEKITNRTAELNQSLHELKATQSQLIQSEKMASLGELTAGIAHEIQNPLNFVNNFSEVNTELVEELREELKAGNTKEAISIADDIKENEQKINHHGKRADAIVKGMLQHSRNTSSQREPTNINALADEYLRLSYHGLRAKDKSFNATLQTDCDQNIGKINIVPQDIGRVLLNLLTNAFYAVSEKKKALQSGVEYEPTVSVTTRLIVPPLGGLRTAEIRVKDNGNGIPQKILDKIYQPFFTTKPTGHGTGLGLSISYDIIKAHGGEIKVNTKEGEGTEFIVILPLRDTT